MSISYMISDLLDLLVFRSPKPPYWVEIKTINPSCTYYFGHFNHPLAAKIMQKGYIDDLIEEKAIIASVKIEQCQPEELTIDETDKTVKISRSKY